VGVTVAGDLVASLSRGAEKGRATGGQLAEHEEGGTRPSAIEQLQQRRQQAVELLRQRRPAGRVDVLRDPAVVVPLFDVDGEQRAAAGVELAALRLRRHRRRL
jgi:hypothetical protein